MTVRLIVIRTTPPRNAAAPIKAKVPEFSWLAYPILKKVFRFIVLSGSAFIIPMIFFVFKTYHMYMSKKTYQ